MVPADALHMIADLKPYPKLKDSRVQWLGEVPGHWEVSKIKSLARPGYKTFVDGDWIESPYITPDGIRLIQTGNIGTGEYREKGFRYISEETFKNFCCTEVEPDDILICRLGEPVARTCLAPRIGKRMITSVDVCILKPRAEANAKFFVYSMSSRRYLDWVGSLVRGSTRDRVSRSMLGVVRPTSPSPTRTIRHRPLPRPRRPAHPALHPRQAEADWIAGGAEAGHHPRGRHRPDRRQHRSALPCLQGFWREVAGEGAGALGSRAVAASSGRPLWTGRSVPD